MLPVGLLAKVLPQSAKNVVMGFVGVDVLSDIQESFICAELLSEGVPPEHVEDVAEKKTIKYKFFWGAVYSLVPFFIGLIPYVVCHHVYNLGAFITTEAVIGMFVVYEAVILVIVGCNFERIDRCITGALSKCRGLCSKDEDHALTMQMSADNNAALAPGARSATATSSAIDASVLGPGVGTTSATVNIGNAGPGVSLGNVKRRSSAFHIFNRATESLGAAGTSNNDDGGNDDGGATRIPVDTGSSLTSATVAAVLGALRMKNVGTTRQGRTVSVIEPGQSSTNSAIQQALDLDKTDKLLFIVDPLDSSNFYLHLADVAKGRTTAGIQINLDRVDILFDRHYDLSLNEEAFARALQDLKLNSVGVTVQGRTVLVIEPGQSSDNRYVRRLLQLERTGERHCFIADAQNKQSVYCTANEIFGTNDLDSATVRRNLNHADRVFVRKVSEDDESDDNMSEWQPLAAAGSGFSGTERSTRSGRRVSFVGEDRDPYSVHSALTPTNGVMFSMTPSAQAEHQDGAATPYENYRAFASSVRSNDDGLGASTSVLRRASCSRQRVVVIEEEDDDEPYYHDDQEFVVTSGPGNAPGWRQKVGSAMSSAALGISSFFGNMIRRKKPSSDTCPIESGNGESSTTRRTSAPTIVAAHTVAVEDDDSSDRDEEEVGGSGSDDDQGGGGNKDNDVFYEDDVNSNAINDQQREWYYDDRRAIDVGIF